MMKLVIFNLLSMVLLLAVLIGCGNETSQQMPIHNKKGKIQPSFIVGGHPVKKDFLQAVVALKIKDSLVCTGTLNSPTEISTAAHCLFGIIPEEAIEDLIGKIEKKLLDHGIQNQDEMKRRVLGVLTDFIENHIEEGIEIYFASDTNFTPNMVKGVKYHKRWFQHSVENYFNPSLKDALGLAKFVGAVFRNYIFSFFQSNRREPIPPSYWQDLRFRYNMDDDYITLILHRPINNIQTIPWIKKDEWGLADDRSLFAVGFGGQFDLLFLFPENRSLVNKIYISGHFLDNFHESKPKQQWEQYLRWKDNNESHIFEKMQTAPLKIQEKAENLILVTTHDLKRSGTCHGDSGAPILIRLKNGQLRQIAVTSLGPNCGTYFIGVGKDTFPDDL